MNDSIINYNDSYDDIASCESTSMDDRTLNNVANTYSSHHPNSANPKLIFHLMPVY
ncbi:hypothetical protein [Candidatus Nitrosocosmicus sp. T]